MIPNCLHGVAPDSARANRILGALPLPDYLPLAPMLEAVQLMPGQVLEEAGKATTHVYFPVSCAATLVSGTRDGDMSELALIGSEGMVGLSALLGSPSTTLQSTVLRPGLAYRLPASALAQALQGSPGLQALAMRYLHSLMQQMAQSVVCSLHHSVLQRLSSWLMFHHTVTGSSQVRATHETIAQMLGVRRESITQAAGVLQQSGCISISRGRITIDNPLALREQVCECFGTIERDHQGLWQMSVSDAMAPHVAAGLLAHAPSDDLLDEPVAGVDARYADIYNFAPVGLLSLDAQGYLIETNMTAAIGLGISRSQCRQYRFVDFLQPESREVFERFHREVLSGRCRHHCELGLMPAAHRPAAVVRLDATVDENGEENRMVMVDITESHQQLARLLHAQGREASAPMPSMAMPDGLRSAPCKHDNLAPSPSAPSAWAA